MNAFERFMKMFRLHGALAAWLLIQVENFSLTKEDVLLAQTYDEPLTSTLEKVIAGNLEAEPDVRFLMLESLNAIIFDLDLDVVAYQKDLGLYGPPEEYKALFRSLSD
jgi:hypothetical protein